MSAADTAPAPANPTPANPARGETALTVGGQTLTVRPSFAALVAAEQQVGPLFALVEQAADGKLTLADTVTLIFHCLIGKPDSLSSEDFGEQVVEAGIAVLTPVLRTLLGQIVKGL